MDNQTAKVIQNISDACKQGMEKNRLVPPPFTAPAMLKGCIQGAAVQGFIETVRPSVAE